MNALLALIWITTGALTIGLSFAVPQRRWDKPSKWFAAGVVSTGAWLVSSLWLAFATVTAFSPTIDSPQPVNVTCGSAWSNLHDAPYLQTDAGRTFDPANGACQASAWRKVAVVGSGELGLAILIGTSSVLVTRRTANDTDPIADRVASSGVHKRRNDCAKCDR